MRWVVAMSWAAFAASVSTAAEPGPKLALPAQVQAQPGEVFRVQAESNLKWMRWKIPAGLTRVPPEWTADGEKSFVGHGPAGVYEFAVEGTLQDRYASAKCTVFVGTPGPGPGPKPPKPNDPLFAELQALYDKDPKPESMKAKDLAALADVYRSGAKVVAKRRDLSTPKQVFAKLREASAIELSGDDALGALRARLADESTRLFGSEAEFNDVSRLELSAYLSRIADLLDALR